MGKKKKPFIDKRSAHSFQLVHRSQKDPLQADEESSKHVLLPIDSSNQGASETESIASDKRRKKDEEEQYGIFFDDDYDYLQHVKPRTNLSLEPLPENVSVIEAKKPLPADQLEFGNVKLPSEAFASRYEQTEGLLNLAAPTSGPRPDLDPDIVAALDDALDLDDPDNILDDDFIAKANKEDADYESDDDLINSDDEDDFFPSDEADESGSDDGMSFFEEEETKSRFTNYSMTSSVLRRNEGLKLIDERFEKVMEEYDEDEIGALDHEELEGTVDPGSERLNALAEEFIESQQNQDLPKMKESGAGMSRDNDEESDNAPDELVRIAEEPKEKWDCESILSTYSNLYNHPTLIKDAPKVKPIKLSKAGIPLGVLSQGGSSKPDKTNEDMEAEETQTHIPRNTIRSRDETKEEKKQRKQEVKSDRKVRRMEKKANKIAFKSEKQRQEQSMLHTKQQQGKKL